MTIDATNASSFATAAALADSRNGTFTGLITTKRGKVVGGTLYGDDTVHAVIITGFSYMSLVERSLAKLQALSAADLTALVADGREGYDSRKKTANLVALTQADYVAARDALVASFQSTLAGTNSSHDRPCVRGPPGPARRRQPSDRPWRTGLPLRSQRPCTRVQVPRLLR